MKKGWSPTNLGVSPVDFVFLVGPFTSIQTNTLVMRLINLPCHMHGGMTRSYEE